MGGKLSKVLLSVGAGGAASFIIYSMMKKSDKRDRGKYDPGKRLGILGLKNCGSTCFLNAVLQAYASCRYVQGWLAVKDMQIAKQVDMRMAFRGFSPYRYANYPMIAPMYYAILVINRDFYDVEDELYSTKVPADVFYGLQFSGNRIGVQQEQDAFEVFRLISSVLNQEVEKLRVGFAPASIENSLDTSSDSDTNENKSSRSFLATLDGTEETIAGEDMAWKIGPGGDWEFLNKPGPNRGIHSRIMLPMNCDYRASPKTPFRFTMFSRMKCILCMEEIRVQLEDAESLTLPLPSPGPHSGLKLIDMLAAYMKPSLVHNVDCITCSIRAAKDEDGNLLDNYPILKSSFSKYIYLAKLPKTLVVHISRCLWGRYGMIKWDDHIQFEEKLNLGSFKRLYDPKQKSVFEGNDGKVFSLEKSENIVRRYKNSEYRLVAVISHVGESFENGRYVTFRRNAGAPYYDSWFYCSDETVKLVPFTTVASAKAYMLFYERTRIPV